ncbi:hypothetical protein D3C87_1714130 [compost metagenome]
MKGRKVAGQYRIDSVVCGHTAGIPDDLIDMVFLDPAHSSAVKRKLADLVARGHAITTQLVNQLSPSFAGDCQ